MCAQLGMASAADAALLTDAHLQQIGMRPLERCRLLQAAARGATTTLSAPAPVAAAPAAVPAAAVTAPAEVPVAAPPAGKP
jgi:hypothetical protein